MVNRTSTNVPALRQRLTEINHSLLLTSVVLSLSVASAHFLPSEEKTHRTLAVAIAALGAIALVKGYRRDRSWRVLALMLLVWPSSSVVPFWEIICRHMGLRFSSL